jgi:phospholipid/cholesterol/gamma-HCH transport system substrate-binding protein
MGRRNIEIMVGVFVAAGVAALVMLAMRVSNLSLINTSSGYEVVAFFDNIGGLKERAPITLSGVRVGRIATIGYDTKRLQARVTLSIAHGYMIPSDTTASIFTSGLLGEQYVALEPGGEEQMLKPGDEIRLTQSALVMEQLIGQFLFQKAADGKEGAAEAPPQTVK